MFFRKKNDDTQGLEDFEEISEKRTSKLGYLLLIIMSVFIIGVGETIFFDLADIPDRPYSPSYCADQLTQPESVKNISRVPNCTYRDIDRKFSIDSLVLEMSPGIAKIVSYNEEIQKNKSTLRSLESTQRDLEKQYDLSLQETIAQEDAIVDKDSTKESIVGIRNEINALTGRNDVLVSQINTEYAKILGTITTLEKAYDDANEYYLTQKAWYKFKIFGLQLLFVAPFFFISLRSYLRLKKKNSPYTIIFTAVLFSSSILFLQILLFFLYEILPKEWIARIFSILLEIEALRYIIYYGAILLIIGLFGGIVYYIQKKVFDPKRVAIRRYKDAKCPKCEFKINHFQNYCPKCGYTLQEKCSSCGEHKVHGLPYCPVCGVKESAVRAVEENIES